MGSGKDDRWQDKDIVLFSQKSPNLGEALEEL